MNIFKAGLQGVLPCLVFLLCTISAFSTSCNQPNTDWLRDFHAAGATTVLLNNASGAIPVKSLKSLNIASLSLGVPSEGSFDSLLNKYTHVMSYNSTSYATSRLHELQNDLKLYNMVIVRTGSDVLRDHHFLSFLRDLKKNRQVIICLSGSEEGLKYLPDTSTPVIWMPGGNAAELNFAAQLVFGGVASSARLSRDVSEFYKRGAGFSTTITRLQYTVPEALGIRSEDLRGIDEIVNSAIAGHVTPSAVVMVVKEGKVIFEKAYGSHTYSDKTPSKADDIYDLASVTKIASTTIAAMRLYEEKKLGLDSALGAYFPLARSTNKNSILIRQLLLHEAGLVEYIPFHNSIQAADHSRDSSALYSVKVADNYFVRKNYYEDVMLPRMLNTTVRPRGKYVYSDLSMYFMKEAIEHISKERIEHYMPENFYQPLGMQTAGFRPSERFSAERLVPTENDTYFRKTLLRGYVHDQGAALAGGVAGHAGLFADANDLAILFQMLLNGGTYGGEHYLDQATVGLFTSRQSVSSRRGLGFDRWDPDPANTYPSELASPETYGHTGFTGTCVWVDPKDKLIYIFLSNRLNDQPANKLSSWRVRPKIQDVIYRALHKAD